MKQHLLLFLCLCCALRTHGQIFHGRILNAQGQPVSDCYVLLLDPESGLVVHYANPNIEGGYTLKATSDHRLSKALLRCQGLAYETQEQQIALRTEQNSYQVDFVLTPKVMELQEVIIISERPKIVINNDTVVYDVAKYVQEGDLKVIDLLRRLPGIEVNERTGQVTYKGKAVETLLIDGEDLFGTAYSVGVRNIPVKIVDKVEAIEDYHANKLEKGLRRSEQVAINLKLKKGIPALSGEIVAGAGTRDYLGNANGILLYGKHKGFGVLETNNISFNETPFQEQTYAAENPQEKERYTFDPLAESQVKNPPGFDRSYDNRLMYGQYTHRARLGETSSLRSLIGGFRDHTRFQQQIDTRFSLTEQDSFRQTNDLSGSTLPRHGVLALEFQTDVADSATLRYELRHSWRSLRAFQENLQNGTARIRSDLQAGQAFHWHQAHYSNRVSANALLNIKMAYAQDGLNQSLRLESPEPVVVQGISMQNAALDNRRRDILLSASLLRKLQGGDVELMFRQNWQKEHFTAEPSGAAPYVFDYALRQSQLRSLFHYALWPKGKLRVEAAGMHALQTLSEAPARSREKNWALNAGVQIEITMSATHKLILNGRRTVSPPLVQHLHQAIILADSRTALTNRPGLDWQTAWNAGISFRRDDLAAQNNQHFSLTYQSSDNNFLASQEIDSLIRIVAWFQSPLNRRTAGASVGHSFLSDPLSLLFTFRAHTRMDWFFVQLNQGLIRNTFNLSSGLHAGVNSAFKGRFNFRLKADVQFVSASQENMTPIRNRIWTNELTAFFRLAKHTQLRLTQQAILPEQAFQWRNQLFFDVFLTHQIPKKRMECFLMARNIFNQANFVQVQANEFSRTVVATSLFSPFVIAGVQVSF